MVLKRWNDLPPSLKTEAVKPYYEVLAKKRFFLFWKRLFDITVSALMLLVFSPIFLVLSLLIKFSSKGPVFFRQVRVTAYGKEFRIFKFRTMVQNAEQLGTQVTVSDDARVTKIGKFLRKYRLDELPQLLDVLRGTMSFVGVRPEVPRYVAGYTPEMMATLLLPAGITSLASIRYKDENRLLDAADDVDEVYLHTVLPAKMAYNLEEIKKISAGHELWLMFQTVWTVLKKEDVSEEKTEEKVSV
ncbi:MAG: sugar transferase [Clostridia bacterium]|nr:sugar transferase [Clostridia bacterium]